MCIGGWPIFKTFRKGVGQVHAPGVAGPARHPADPDLDGIIARPYCDVEVEATVLGFNHAAMLLHPDRCALRMHRAMIAGRRPFALVRARACWDLRANASARA